ncbi:MAG: hypothetical protein NTX47_00145 [Candidatus Omnitrophica bacterium]|nr:hypothetical protein [Candidatus Omnitrophota bacterium]
MMLSIDPIASTTVTGVGTQFLTQLAVDNILVVSGEVRVVTAIASDTSLTVDTAFSDNPNDTSPDKHTFRWSWPFVSIDPRVNVEPGLVYYVVVEGAGSGGAIRNSATIPTSYDYVTINASVYQSPSGTFNASPTETTTSMYGLVDVQVEDRLRDDVWYSSDGSNWTQATSNAAFGLRSSYSCEVFDNKMWVIGGTLPQYCRQKDAWWSTDGANWTRATSAAWANTRAMDASVVFKNRLWTFTRCVGDNVQYTNSDYWNP